MPIQLVLQTYRHALTKKPMSVTRSSRASISPVTRTTSVEIATTKIITIPMPQTRYTRLWRATGCWPRNRAARVSSHRNVGTPHTALHRRYRHGHHCGKGRVRSIIVDCITRPSLYRMCDRLFLLTTRRWWHKSSDRQKPIASFVFDGR